jgi:hypothetical protein
MATEQTAPTAATTPQPAPATPISGVEAIRRAREELGPKATRSRIQSLVKERYGLDLTAKYVTDTVSKLRSRGKKKKKKAKPAAAAAAAAPRPAVAKQATQKKPAPPPARPVSQASKGGASVLLGDLQEVQSLLKRVGPTQLRAMIDLLIK